LVRTANGDVGPEELRQAVESDFANIQAGLERLVAIPSVSAAGHDPSQVRRCAEAARDWLLDAGLQEARLLEVPGAHPAVFGQTPGPPGAPTVLLYAHHDVQPAGTDERWDSPAFTATKRDGRLYGRGTADDKAGIAAHVAALRAWRGAPPVTVSVFLEGEEEIASPHLDAFLDRHGDLLKADAYVLADCSNWSLGTPALTTSLRGILDFTVEVKTLDHAVHSGVYGGPVPDALTVLCRLIASLHQPNGDVAVPGLRTGPSFGDVVSEDHVRRFTGLDPDFPLLGSGTVADRLWSHPAIAVVAIDAPPVAEAANKLVPVARAKVSVRLAPGDDAASAEAAIRTHLKDQLSWGATVTVTTMYDGAPHQIDTSGPAFEAFRKACAQTWGCSPVEAGSGGSLPIVAALASAFPGAPLLLTGVADPDSLAHSENESVHLAELEKCCVNEAILLGELAGPG
jgi:acetylornithine deacetylase/succinyl-diaminopimelate desuccinylase-like protein